MNDKFKKFELNAFTCMCPKCNTKLIFNADKVKGRRQVRCIFCKELIEVSKLKKYKPYKGGA